MNPVLAREDCTVPPRCCALEAVLARAGAHRSALLQLRADDLARHVRLSGSRSPHPGSAGRAAASWLLATFGEQDERLKRGAVAALTLSLAGRIAHLPASLRITYDLARERLQRTLQAERPYRADFDKDISVVSGLSAWIGPFSVILPEPECSEAVALRARRTLMRSARFALNFGWAEAQHSLATAGLRPWLELHLDTRALKAFNTQGLTGGYHIVADLLRSRPDIAGLYGGSWLYDPRLSAISPELSFVRRTAEDGGARIVRMRRNPVQVGFAVARSSTRRSLVESGDYRPACYGMYWSAADLIRWSEGAVMARRAIRQLRPGL